MRERIWCKKHKRWHSFSAARECRLMLSSNKPRKEESQMGDDAPVVPPQEPQPDEKPVDEKPTE